MIVHFDGSLWTGYPASGSAIHAIRGTSNRDVWAVGDDILHWDGSSWTASYAPAPARLNAIWTLAADDIWVAGDDGCVMHFDGRSWMVVRMMANETVSSIWASSATDVWAVGSEMVHFDGIAWTSIDGPPSPSTGIISAMDQNLPSTLFDQVTFSSVWGSGPHDVWAYGDQVLRGLGVARAGVFHYDGAAWSQVLDANVGGTYQILGTGPDDVWFLGYGAQHFDGKAWRTYETVAWHLAGSMLGPGDLWTVGRAGDLYRLINDRWYIINPQRVNERYCLGGSATAMWASSSLDVWAVGGPNILRFDGHRWSAISSSCFDDLGESWTGVSGTAANDVWMVGSDGTSRGAARHFDGTAMRSVPLPPETSALNAVWASGRDDVWAVGTRDVLHWSGGTWTRFDLVGAPDPQGGSPQMTAIGGSGPHDLWLVGARSMAARWDGSSWTAFQVPTSRPFDFHSVWAAGPSDVWIAGNADPLMHWNGVTWIEALPSGSGVWGTGPSDVWTRTTDANVVSSRTGTVAHWDGAAWTTAFLHAVEDYSGASGAGFFGVAASGDVWAFGDGMLAHHARAEIAGAGGAGGTGAPPTGGAEIPSAACATLVPAGDWIAGTAIKGKDVPAPAGGPLADGVYDLVSFLDWTPRPGFRQRRTIEIAQGAAIFRFAGDLQDPSGVTTEVRYEATTRFERQSLEVRSTCGDPTDFPFGYTATDAGLVIYSPDPAIRDEPNSEALVYTYRRRSP